MKRKRDHKKILYSIISGLMLTASFPPGKLDWLAWFALVPLLKALEDVPPSRALKLGLYAGFAHYITLIYWIVVVLEHYGGLNMLISLAVLILFCLYLSIYPALFSLLTRYLKGSRFSLFMTAGIWVALEYLRSSLLTGFPWCLIGYTQYQNLWLIQSADLVGVYGLSFLLVLSNGLIYMLFFTHNPIRRPLLKLEFSLIILLMVLTLVYGNRRIAGSKTDQSMGQSINIAVVQGNIDQSVKWHPAYQAKTIDQYRRLTLAAEPYKPHLIIWPETSVPFFFQNNSALSKRVSLLPKQLGTYLIFGSPAHALKGGKTRYYNRAYSLTPGGEVSGYYDKTHLVPFGEYVPLKRFLPFVHRLVTAAGDFTAGEEIDPLKMPILSSGILICFEVIFPELARTHVRKGADILVNLTNDAWFGRTSAPYQHLSMAVFRAVENRRPLIRAANTGISAFINAEGKVMSQGGLFQEEVLFQKIRYGDPSQGFYTKYGDLFAILLLIISLIKTLHLLFYKLFIGQPKWVRPRD